MAKRQMLLVRCAVWLRCGTGYPSHYVKLDSILPASPALARLAAGLHGRYGCGAGPGRAVRPARALGRRGRARQGRRTGLACAAYDDKPDYSLKYSIFLLMVANSAQHDSLKGQLEMG
jgi:hypothetical protein